MRVVPAGKIMLRVPAAPGSPDSFQYVPQWVVVNEEEVTYVSNPPSESTVITRG